MLPAQRAGDGRGGDAVAYLHPTDRGLGAHQGDGIGRALGHLVLEDADDGVDRGRRADLQGGE